MNKVLDKIKEYKESLAQISENRKVWSEKTKQIIYETLIKVKRATDLDWNVQKVEVLANLEAVNIHFNKQASGLINTIGTSKINYTKYGGALIFSQAYNGHVFVIYEYPHVEKCVSQLENKLIEKMHPNTITEEVVLDHVVKFLEEMSRWERSNTKTQIGFAV